MPSWLFLLLLTLTPPFTYGAWRLWKRLYVRKGPARRIGIAIEGVSIQPDELRETRRNFRAIAEDLDHDLRLIWLPADWLATEAVAKETASRYGLAMVSRICVKKAPASDGDRSIECMVHRRFSREVNKELLKSEAFPIEALLKGRESPIRNFSVEHFVARSILEILLLQLSTKYVNDSEHESAGVLLEGLDRQLELQNVSKTQQPRRAIRFMIMSCSRARAIRPASQSFQTPDISTLARAMDQTVRTYGDEFPEILVTAARTAFVAGDQEAALRYATRLVRDAPTKELRGYGHFAEAVLRLFRNEYSLCRDSFELFLQAGILSSLNWDDLIDFATACRTNGISGAIFLCCFYRLIHKGQTLPDDLLTELNQWFAEDDSRACLQWMLEKHRWKFAPHQQHKTLPPQSKARGNNFKQRRGRTKKQKKGKK